MIEIANLFKEYDFVTFALLFGSYAKSKAHSMSDIDIAIDTNKEIDLLTQGRIIAELEAMLGKKVDLVIVNELYKKSLKFAYDISINHKVIFNHDNDVYHDFTFNSLKYYMDTKPMYELFDNALHQRIADGNFAKTQTP